MNGFNSFKAFIKKEILEGMRTKKFLVLSIGVLFFAFQDTSDNPFTTSVLEWAIF